MISSNRPLRVLHVVGGMNLGGVETWLMGVLRRTDPQQFQMDFLVHTEDPCPYDEEIRALGSRVIPCMTPRRPWRYARNFRRILKKYGPYDIVHSHVHHFSGFVLKLAHSAGVPVRVTNSHNDTTAMEQKANLFRRMYLKQCEHWLRKHATLGFAVSRKAAQSLWGKDWRADKRWHVLHPSIDLEPFCNAVNRAAVRNDLGIPQDALVVGHVGGFRPQKNHGFLLEIAAGLAQIRPNMRLLLIGDGPLRPEIERKAAELRITSKIVFAGLRRDVSRLMLGAMDVFVMPSLHEGLPLVGIEAQAAGLPCVLSDVITDELEANKALIHWVSSNASPAVWVDVILNSLHRPSGIPAPAALAGTSFDIDASISELCKMYVPPSLS